MATQEAQRRLFIPALSSQGSTFRADILRGTFGYEPLPIQKIRTDNREDVFRSLTEFTQGLGQAEVNSIVGRHIKMGEDEMPERDFAVAPYSISYSLSMEHGYFFSDGQAGLVLETRSAYDENRPLGLALASFNFPERVEGNPVIVQLQTFSPKEAIDMDFIHLKTEARSVIKKIRWEKALIEIAMNWARSENFPFLYVQPGSENHWIQMHSLEDRAKIRYDVTAQRMGFERMSNGLWGFKLNGAPAPEGLK